TNDRNDQFIVEVSTCEPNPRAEKWEKQFRDLQMRVRVIPLDYELSVASIPQQLSLGSSESKQIATEIERWLRRDRPTVGAKHESIGITFKVIACERSLRGLQLD